MATILQLARIVTLGETPFIPGVYEVVEAGAGDGQIQRKIADKLLSAYPDSVKEFKDSEPISNLLEWKKQNTVVKS